jgi:hypothetical protein
VNINKRNNNQQIFTKLSMFLVPRTIYLFGKTEGVSECPACNAPIYGAKTQDVK